MTSIGIRHPRAHPTAQPTRSAGALQRALFIAGVLSSLLYVAVDLVASIRYPGYRLADQAISELSAIGAPTSGLWSATMPLYSLLLVAFAIGVLRAVRANRALRVTGALLLVFAISGVLWRLFPMHQRGTAFTWQDTGHLILSVGTVLLILSFIGVGAFALGQRFRVYSFVTTLALVGSGAVVFAGADRIAAGERTPWLGLFERISLYGCLLWVAVLAITLLGREGLVRHSTPEATRR